MKKTWVRKTLSIGIMAAGALLLAPAAAAQADSIGQAGYGNLGALNGTQIAAPIKAPSNQVGNSLGLAGIATGSGYGANHIESGKSGKHATGGDRISQASHGNFGVLNGTQVAVPITVPVNMNGNADSILGHSSASGSGVNRVESGRGKGGHSDGGGIDQATYGNYGVLNGTQVAVPITVPVNVCGNSTALLGHSSAEGDCANRVGDTVSSGKGHHYGRTESASKAAGWGDDIAQAGAYNWGLLNGTQIAAPFTMPANICGNSFGGLLGMASASGACANQIGDTYEGRRVTHGHKGKPGDGYGDVSDVDNGDDGYGDVSDVDNGDDGYGDVSDVDTDDSGYGDVSDVDTDDSGYGHGEKPAHTKPAHTKPAHTKPAHTKPAHAKPIHAKPGKGHKPGSGHKGDKGGKGHNAGNKDAGYGGVNPDTYGGGKGGRSIEKSSVGELTSGVGSSSLGGLDLLDTLR
ncbi:chaplin family protein [Actinoplanes sp. NPDC051851]|uniref:chaplin family protein n=1 Tax=Actinoplanes sp. NPDC051851 TaxID=3154753 RepID=UPI003414B269